MKKEAFVYYQKAASLGHREAQFKLAKEWKGTKKVIAESYSNTFIITYLTKPSYFSLVTITS